MSKRPTERVGRDDITQNGSNNSVKIDNRSTPLSPSKKEWHDTAIGKVAIGIVVAVLATIVIATLNLKK